MTVATHKTHLSAARPIYRRRPERGPYRAPERDVDHVRDPEAADGKMVLRVYPDGVAVVANGDGRRVVDLHDRIPSVVDIRKLVLASFAGGDEEDIAAGQVVN